MPELQETKDIIDASPPMRIGGFSAVVLMLMWHAMGSSAAEQYPTARVKSIYDSPLLADPRLLWDRWDDLLVLRRGKEAALLGAYIERSQMQIILGETPRSAPTLAVLLERERNTPEQVDGPLRERILAMVQATLDESPDATLMPPKPFVKYRNEGHGVWSDAGSDHAFLRLKVANHTHRPIARVEVRANINGSGSASLLCDESEEVAMSADADGVVILCNTWEARSHVGAPLTTSQLLELMKQVDAGTATLALPVVEIGFPREEILVGRTEGQPYREYRTTARAYPFIGTVTCADIGMACERGRDDRSQVERERLIYNPLTFAVAIVLLAAVVGYLSPPAARFIGILAIIGGIVAAVMVSGSGPAGLLWVAVAGVGLLFGISALIASVIFRDSSI